MPIGTVEFQKVEVPGKDGKPRTVEKPFLAGNKLEITPECLWERGWFGLRYSDLLDGLDIEYEQKNKRTLKNVRTYAVLPQELRRILSEEYVEHPGLALDKLMFRCADQSVAKYALGKVTEINNKLASSVDWYKDLVSRWTQLLIYRGVVIFTGLTQAPLTLHLARASALENAGICMHPIYGFVYMPGTGLKGMARAFAETVWLPTQLGTHWASATDSQWNEALDKLDQVFGYAPYIERPKDEKLLMSALAQELDRRRRQRNKTASQEAKAHVGQIIFYDAWPVRWPILIVDILNNHHPSYYQNEDPPGDWDSPVPVYFLSVPPDQSFLFAVGKRRHDVPEELLELALDWLIGALMHEGAGAKTAAGYGQFHLEQPPEPIRKAQQQVEQTWKTACEQERRTEFQCTLELITPAFLAGAYQFAPEGEKDCQLRPATLRGLLRWWWRTMHAGHVDAHTLARLEAAVWGDTHAAGAVRICIRPKGQIKPLRYDKEAVKQQNRLPDPPDKKTTPGLYYFSFGMDDKRRENGRYYIAPGAKWEVRFTVRPSAYERRNKQGQLSPPPIPLPDPSLLLQQAQAALWLLCHFGGVGSKSRKGFGCFRVPDPLRSWNIDQCKQIAKSFREACGIPDSKPAGSPSLEDMLIMEDIATPWTNPWVVLDRIGAAAQEFAKQYKHNLQKKALGLPRKIGSPPRGSFTPGLHVRNTDRHASPVFYHVDQEQGDLKQQKYIIRCVAFPSPELPDDASRQKSRDFLQELIKHLSKQWTNWCNTMRNLGTPSAQYPSMGKSPTTWRLGATGIYGSNAGRAHPLP
jgi:CRISPR-associated protein Cmr6